MNPVHLFPRSVRSARRALVLYWVLLAIGTHLPSLGVGKDANQIGMFQVDKTLHVIGFAGLAWLLYRAKIMGEQTSMFANALAATLVAGTYAVIDEYTQQWTGREVSYSDVVAGFIGVFGVFLVLGAPAPRQKVGRLTKLVRLLTAVVVIVVLVFALAPEGNNWVNKLARPFFQPWPDIDKAGHFYLSAAMTLLLAMCYPAGVHRPRLSVFLTILVMGVSGPIIETAQSLTGRGVEMADLYAHQVGLLAAMLALVAVVVAGALKNRLTR